MALQSSRSLRITVYGGMAAVLLIGLAAAFWPFLAANRQLQAFCDAQAVGTPLAQVQADAIARGYALAAAASGAVVVDDPPGLGRRQCTLALDAQDKVAAPR